ncbi:O-fucosyltransferase family protein [Rhodotorula paludigena]|uniref:O-fucosyltransferase family protein n=1 Tax=Rhodotorula paludigena TaxID=86838 RepID=UPI003178F9AE
MAGGRHRNPGSEVTFKGGDTPFALPFSTSTGRSSPPAASAFNGEGPRARRPAAMNDSSELDIRYDMHDISPTTQQPDFSFPTVSSAAYSPPPSPPPKEALPVLAKKGAGGFYSKSSSIAQAREHKSARQGPLHHQHQQAPQWRDKGQELARLRKKAASDKGLSMQQIVAGAGTLAVLVLVVVLWGSSRGKSPLVKHMQRREQILAASLMPSPPGITKQKEVRKHDSFRDELSTDSRYVISPAHGDFAEQTMNLYHLTHLSTILSRIPIAHPFLLPDDSGQIAQHPVPTIFDLSRFSAGTSVAVLDWNDLRPHEGAETGKTEPLGCWVGQIGETERDDRAKRMRLTGLSPSFVPVRLAPSKSAAGQGDDLKGTHSFLSRFDKDASAKSGLIDQARHDASISTAGTSTRHAVPENHVFCIDHSLYRPEHPTSKQSTTHLDPRDHTAFFKHGKHLHFSPELHETAGDIAAHLLGHRLPFLAVHISAKARASECRLLNQPGRCEPNLLDYQRAVDRVRHLVASGQGRKSREHRHSARSLQVLVSTDVKDLAFLGELANLGWTLLDYEDLELRERFGRWDPEVMDQAVESRSHGFIGTRGSAQSTLSALRVRTWRQGPTELV